MQAAATPVQGAITNPFPLLVPILQAHGIEVWEGCAVELYSRQVDGVEVMGEHLIPLGQFTSIKKLYIWLGY